MCRRVGNTNKLGAMFGILSAIGAPVPSPGSPTFFVRLAINAVRSFISGTSLTLYHPSSQQGTTAVYLELNTSNGPPAKWLHCCISGHGCSSCKSGVHGLLPTSSINAERGFPDVQGCLTLSLAVARSRVDISQLKGPMLAGCCVSELIVSIEM